MKAGAPDTALINLLRPHGTPRVGESHALYLGGKMGSEMGA